MMVKFRKGDKIESPMGAVGLVLKRKKDRTTVFWLDNLNPKYDREIPDRGLSTGWYGWHNARVENLTEDLVFCKKIGRFTDKEYGTYKVLYGDNK